LPGAIANGPAAGVSLSASLSPFLGPIIYGINLSALDPNSAFGAGGSSVVTESTAGFFESLAPTAAGLADGGGPAPAGDATIITIGDQPARRCFDAQPLAHMWCRKGR
jgi:hypothetical protein